MDGIRIDPTHTRYDEIYAAWEANSSPGQFDMLIWDESNPPEVIGGSIFRAAVIEGTLYFWQEAGDESTPIPEGKSGKIDPGWSFASMRYRGEYTVRRRNGFPGLQYQKLINQFPLE